MSRSWLIRIVVVMGLVAASSVAVIATGSAAQADPTLPTISEAFGASTIVAGATSTVDFTITNTAAGGAQSGLAFTDTLPTGLTPLDSGPAPSTTCATGANLKVSGQQISVDTLSIDAGSTSCTVSFGVQAAAAGTFTNEPADIASTTLNLPTSASVLMVSDPSSSTPKVKSAIVPAAAPAAQATAPTTWACTNVGLLFQTPKATSHTVTQVNLVSGATTAGTSTTAIVNGLGFNVLDNYIYGWSNATFSLVQIGQNGVVNDLGNPPGVVESGTVFDGYPLGDVDPQGHLWWADDLTGQWYEIDVDQTSATFGTVLAQGKMAVPAIGLPSDWAYINGSLYGVVGVGSGLPHLFQFNTTSHVMTDLGQVSGGGISGQNQFFGAAYATSDGFLWVGNNVSGNLYRIDVSGAAPFHAIAEGKGPAATSNDGARCANAPIPAISITKDVGGRVDPTDQFTVSLEEANGDSAGGADAVTTGTETTAVSPDNPIPVLGGTSYLVTDAVTSGPSSLSNYTATIACTNKDTGATVPAGGTTGAWTVLSANTGTGTDEVDCVVTNTPVVVAKPTITVVKDVASRRNANDQFTVGLVDSSSTTLTSASTTGTNTTAATTAWPVSPSTQYTVTDAVSGPDSLTSYNASIACVDTATNAAVSTGATKGAWTLTSSATDPITCTVTNSSIPSYSVAKSASVSVAKPGQTVTYTVTVTNTGGVAYTAGSPASFTDDLSDVLDDATYSGDAKASDGSTVGYVAPVLSWSGALAVGATTTITYTVKVNTPDTGTHVLTNIANPGTGGMCALGGAAPCPPVIVNVADLTVKKSASPTTVSAAGQTVNYAFLVTNTGPVALTNLVINESQFTGGNGPLSISCPVTTLASLASTTCTATYTVTQADLDSGGLTNTATVTGTTPGNSTTTSPPSSATVPSTATGVLNLVKLARSVDVNSDGIVDVGDLINWTFLVTDTGTATVTGVTVSDPTAGAVTCPQTSLAPGQSMICTAAAHVITAADVNRGRVVNTAVASGGVNGTPTTSNTATATVTVQGDPPVALASTGVVYGPDLIGIGIAFLLLGSMVMLAGVRRRPGVRRTP